MIEPIIGDKQCTCCMEVKRLTEFSPCGGRWQSRCKKCRATINARKQRRVSKRGRQGEMSGDAWNVPTMTLAQSLACITFRKAMCAMPAERRLFL